MTDTVDQKYSGDNFRGSDSASPYPVSRLGAPVSLVDSARIIEAASSKVALRTNAQLEVIVDFSMLGPAEFGGAVPSGFVASYRYEHDESWTRVDEVDARDRRRAEIQGFVSNRLLKE